MTTTGPTIPRATSLREALEDLAPSARLQAAMAAGMQPGPADPPVLVARCALEPDFYVRDMLTWALTRHPAAVTVPLLLAELRDGSPQARSQALHTLSKVGDPRGWTAITPELLRDPEDEVARTAWRAAVALVPEGAEADLAATLVTQLGRGGPEVRRSLSRALVDLGEAAGSALAEAATRGDVATRTHAIATQRLTLDPEQGFEASVSEAERVVALMDAPVAGGAEASSGDPGADR
ncbi:HEAT repeat domain-containing protein [Auraticoccus monumenti]|uniref:HEAT repeat-containing protein n=1 Tax=Auraticoccus monumenti TaxID=675864 RepID=A0A1G6SKE4_9ACTN|nr:HEAT repeat domain-containing protein [Auraticoccus monumenti]SDD16615.1 HEAT repeat-containing protein [Auraticoccus monumenti]